MKEFTEKEAKNSMYFKWRLYNIAKSSIISLAITLLPMIFLSIVVFIICLNYNLSPESLGIQIGAVTIFGLVLVVIAVVMTFNLFHIIKAFSFLNNYTNFTYCEAVLSKAYSSDKYKNCVLYLVKIRNNGINAAAKTHPMFGNSILHAPYKSKDYEGKKVSGFYDGNTNRFYIYNVVEEHKGN